MAGFEVILDGLRQTEMQLNKQLTSIREAIAALSGGAWRGRRGRQKLGLRKRRGTRRSKLSAAGRKAISDAQKKRWAKQKAAALKKER